MGVGYLIKGLNQDVTPLLAHHLERVKVRSTLDLTKAAQAGEWETRRNVGRDGIRPFHRRFTAVFVHINRHGKSLVFTCSQSYYGPTRTRKQVSRNADKINKKRRTSLVFYHSLLTTPQLRMVSPEFIRHTVLFSVDH